MKLGEKLRYLRHVEGTLRGLQREMTQQEVVRAVKKELKESISQSYLSQIESGSRPHLTNTSRTLLSRFFKVHPGYLVDDPEGFHTELQSDLRALEDRLDMWLINGAERFRKDPELCQALLDISQRDDSRKCLVLLGAILETPQLVDRLLHVLKPGATDRDTQADSLLPSSSARNKGGGNRMTLLLMFSAINWAITWAGFYLLCFVVGFALTLLTFLAGTMHLHVPTRMHMPHAGHGGVPAHPGHAHAGQGSGISVFNFSTVVAFLVWFGGTGYLLTHYGRLEVLVGFAVAVVGGLVGASIVFWFLVKLLSFDNTMDPADYDRVGLIARVNVPIRQGDGTGEIVFSQAGTRRVSGARSDDGSLIAKGAEVVITRCERGIAYVKPWNEFADEDTPEESDSAASGDDGRRV